MVVYSVYKLNIMRLPSKHIEIYGVLAKKHHFTNLFYSKELVACSLKMIEHNHINPKHCPFTILLIVCIREVPKKCTLFPNWP